MLPIELTEFILDSMEYDHYGLVNTPPDQLTSTWVVHDANLATMKLNLDIPYKEIEAEAINCGEKLGWYKHRGDNHPGWTSIAIHGQHHHATNTPDHYPELDGVPFQWTEAAALCPITKQWLEDSPFINFHRVRFMLLEPGGFILPHRDYEDNRLGPVNIAISNPAGCNFYMEKAGVVPWVPGDVRMINVGKLHAVYNNSNQRRIHIIVHSGRDHTFNNLVESSFKSNVWPLL